MIIVEKQNATYKEIMEALNSCANDEEVRVKYNTVRNFDLNEKIEELASNIKEMTVNQIYRGDDLENKIKDFYNNNIKGEYKDETYYVRKFPDGSLEFSNSSFILFNDVEGNVKSVYVRNIKEIEINGVNYIR
jgi:hypothetical protein